MINVNAAVSRFLILDDDGYDHVINSETDRVTDLDEACDWAMKNFETYEDSEKFLFFVTVQEIDQHNNGVGECRKLVLDFNKKKGV